MAEPPAKKPRTEAGEAETPAPAPAIEAAEPEPEVEKEADAKPLSGPSVSGPVTFYTQDTTMNVMKSSAGNMLVPLTDGGLTYLCAGARANVGIKSGRYCFEFKIVEFLNFVEDTNARLRVQVPRTQLRVGVATEGSCLFVGETVDSVGFDSEGHFLHNKTKTACSQKYAADVVTVVLNLEEGSENANTISLFKNGQRASPPQPLPDNLKGKALFPAVTFKNVSVQYNFGPSTLASLPFKCHTVAEAAKADVTKLAEPKGQGEAIFPVCLPDEGTFDWLDMFLEQNPSYAELSDRAILQWAERSGITKATGYNVRSSNDKPEMGFGVMHLDDYSIRRALQSVVPLQGRNVVVMEVKSNLLKEERKELVSKFAGLPLKKKAVVMMKSPPAAFKKRSQELALKQKQEAVNLEHQAKLAEEKRQRLAEKKAKELEKQKAKVARRVEKEKAVIAKKVEFEKKKAEAKEAGLTEEQMKEQEAQNAQELEAIMADSGSEDAAAEEAAEEDPMDEDPPTAELTDEEKQRTFRKLQVPDLTTYTFNTNFMKFSLPEKDEGFDEISFDWAKEGACQSFMKEWKQQLKTTTRVEDIKPGEWFNGRFREWQKTLQSWHAKANGYKALIAKKAAEKQAREAKRAALAAAKEAKEKAEAEKKAAAAAAAAARRSSWRTRAIARRGRRTPLRTPASGGGPRGRASCPSCWGAGAPPGRRSAPRVASSVSSSSRWRSPSSLPWGGAPPRVGTAPRPAAVAVATAMGAAAPRQGAAAREGPRGRSRSRTTSHSLLVDNQSLETR
mmetsp:Transcript_8629/g.19179  ORF Transcript_8629/g.19179 Transcript_8629/m.19179 type:complete len:788 (+) Transcript_8629:62-2425(+)